MSTVYEATIRGLGYRHKCHSVQRSQPQLYSAASFALQKWVTPPHPQKNAHRDERGTYCVEHIFTLTPSQSININSLVSFKSFHAGYFVNLQEAQMSLRGTHYGDYGVVNP